MNEKEFTSIEVTRRREGEINYAKDHRPVLGTSTSEVEGPGSRYQIERIFTKSGAIWRSSRVYSFTVIQLFKEKIALFCLVYLHSEYPPQKKIILIQHRLTRRIWFAS